MESELWPNLIMGASKCGVSCFLLGDFVCMYVCTTIFWPLRQKKVIHYFVHISVFTILVFISYMVSVLSEN